LGNRFGTARTHVLHLFVYLSPHVLRHLLVMYPLAQLVLLGVRRVLRIGKQSNFRGIRLVYLTTHLFLNTDDAF
jgi:hypothetical protein